MKAEDRKKDRMLHLLLLDAHGGHNLNKRQKKSAKRWVKEHPPEKSKRTGLL